MNTSASSLWLSAHQPPEPPNPEAGRQVYRCRDQHGGVEVRQDADYRWLLFDPASAEGDAGARPVQSAMQLSSPGRLVLPYMQLLVAALAWQPLDKASAVLQLGLGGGAINRWLAQLVAGICYESGPGEEFSLTSVESRPAVVEAYQHSFSADVIEALAKPMDAAGTSSPHVLTEKLHAMDAADYLDSVQGEAVSLVVVDMYPASELEQLAAGHVLQNWLSAKFFQQLGGRMKPDAVLALNLPHRDKAALSQIYREARSVFAQAGIVEITGYENLVLYLGHQPPRVCDPSFQLIQPLLDVDLLVWQRSIQWIAKAGPEP